MQLILVRHAQPRWADPAGAAVNDPGLTSLGLRQAQRLAERASRWSDVSGLVVSTARRSRETAEPIAAVVGLEPTVCSWLHEIRLPADWDGTPAEEVGRVLREARARPRSEWWDGLPGGESFRDFHRRVNDGLATTLTAWGVTRHATDPDHLWDLADPDQRIVVVAHAGTNSVVLGALLGLEAQPWEWERFAADHASITVLETVTIAGGHIWSLQRFSDASHLAADMVTA